MFAVIESGGKQYRVSVGESIAVEKLYSIKGDRIEFDRVLLLSTDTGLSAGTPTLEGVRVIGTVSRQYRGPKVYAFRYKPKKRVRALKGHRQDLTQIYVRDILVNGQSLVQPPAASSPPDTAEATPPSSPENA
ncbi:MAG: 50S ribosomal protein L21 [Chloroflexi bacterium]|nr:50S ribosomal protein L21 [Chloroflexota bacterium]